MDSFHDREISCPRKNFYIFERSLYSSLNVFARLNCNEIEFKKLEQRMQNLGRSSMYDNIKTAYIYIRTTSKVCMQRIQERNKQTDKYIDLEYLQTLERCHDNIFLDRPDCVVINGDVEPLDLLADVEDAIHKILRKVM